MVLRRLLLLASFALVACAPEPGAPRAGLQTGERLVREAVHRANPNMNPEAVFPVREITPEPVWLELGLQVFQVTEQATTQQHETFVVRGQEVVHIASGIGGMGVESLLAADLDGDGSAELVFSYSWGSGIHRSQVGALVRRGDALSELTADWAFRGDVELERDPRGAVYVCADGVRLGQVALEQDALRVLVRPDLPETLQQKVWR